MRIDFYVDAVEYYFEIDDAVWRNLNHVEQNKMVRANVLASLEYDWTETLEPPNE